MAKAPQPGKVKTRLIPALGADATAKLAKKMLLATLRHAQAAAIGKVELCGSPTLTDPAWSEFEIASDIRHTTQCEGDLGTRMAEAVQRNLADQSTDSVIVIGTDCIEINAGLLQQATLALKDHDVVIYPTKDGGYALLGLKQYLPGIFTDIPWSTSVVAKETLCRLYLMDVTVWVGPLLHDIDTPEDLIYLSGAFGKIE